MGAVVAAADVHSCGADAGGKETYVRLADVTIWCVAGEVEQGAANGGHEKAMANLRWILLAALDRLANGALNHVVVDAIWDCGEDRLA